MAEITREDRQKKITFQRFSSEITQEYERLRELPDYFPELDYFLDLLKEGQDPSVVEKRVQKPVVALMCLQAPLELFHACGLHPFKIFGGSQVTTRLSSPVLPPVMCPMLRSALGTLMLGKGFSSGNGSDNSAELKDTKNTSFSFWGNRKDKGNGTYRPVGDFKAWVTPTTCDWVVKLDELLYLCGVENKTPAHRLELPHTKDRPESQERWLEEIYLLKKFLLVQAGMKKLQAKVLNRSMDLYQQSWKLFSSLIDLKRQGLVSLSWFLVIANSFFYDDIEIWMEELKKVLVCFRKRNVQKIGPRVFVAGSPIFFPNLKMARIIEEAGLVVVMDDLCSSERLFPGAVFFDDYSEHGLLKALTQRYHQGCLCPTFADNDRRVNNILAPAHKELYDGVIFHVLKGCHPFDLESLSLEAKIKGEGLKYLKLETDYTAEDSQTLLTRLEAFRSALVG
ncbi:MAG: 2-hydroxyacyl-CoA dehydratase family protein [Deltaproteobacteria bacterium]|jgi:benzoyl-CoA reductase/2-hydroxyglutaryl-CoA dehydratase subunit BcrC/BadD/HgdB|nr:2-hydroxyacyl-CoA dehydratase family protein [Deltaproteobacteria bacterium]